MKIRVNRWLIIAWVVVLLGIYTNNMITWNYDRKYCVEVFQDTSLINDSVILAEFKRVKLGGMGIEKEQKRKKSRQYSEIIIY